MDKELKDRWVKALRSGEYEQGKGRLCRVDEDGGVSYCCLGVLCEIIGGEDIWVGNEDFPGDLGVESSIGLAVAYPPASMSLDVGLAYPGVLADMNDSQGMTFEQIADYIEENL